MFLRLCVVDPGPPLICLCVAVLGLRLLCLWSADPRLLKMRWLTFVVQTEERDISGDAANCGLHERGQLVGQQAELS